MEWQPRPGPTVAEGPSCACRDFRPCGRGGATASHPRLIADSSHRRYKWDRIRRPCLRGSMSHRDRLHDRWLFTGLLLAGLAYVLTTLAIDLLPRGTMARPGSVPPYARFIPSP